MNKTVKIFNTLIAAVALMCAADALAAALDTPEQHIPSTHHDSGSLAQRLGGEWAIVKVGDVAVSPEEEDMPYVNFESGAGRFYGSNGCNVINGTFTTSGSNSLKFSSVISTMKACPHISFQQKITSVLSEGNTVYCKFTHSDYFTTVTLQDSRGMALLTLQRHRFDYLNGQWLVKAIEGEDITENVDGDDVNIFFDTQELTLHGNTGCNYFNGLITIDPTVPNSISFSKMGVTRMACPKSSRETKMLVALEETTSCIHPDSHTVILTDAVGKHLLTLKKM